MWFVLFKNALYPSPDMWPLRCFPWFSCEVCSTANILSCISLHGICRICICRWNYLPGQRAFAFNIWLTLPNLSLKSLGQLALPQTGTSGFHTETVCGPWVTMWEASARWMHTLQARHCIKNVTYIPVKAAPLRASHIPFAAALGARIPRLLGEGRSQVYLLSEPCQQCETYLSENENRKTRFTN